MESEEVPMKKLGIQDRVVLPTRIIVHRFELTAAALGEVLQSGELTPETGPGAGPVCELEAGGSGPGAPGQVLARGRIVKKRGTYWFKVTETEVSS